MAFRNWCYPALVIHVKEGNMPDRGALRVLVKRMRREAFSEVRDPVQRRYKVRQAINALFVR